MNETPNYNKLRLECVTLCNLQVSSISKFPCLLIASLPEMRMVDRSSGALFFDGYVRGKVKTL